MTRWPIPRRLALTRFVLIGVAVLAVSRSAMAHEGPPFPILMDQPVSGYLVSVWADPDIGEAEFFIIIESPEGKPLGEPPRVSMWVEPVDGRLERTQYDTTRQPLREQMQFRAAPHFDQRDTWNVGFRLTAPGGEPQELTTQVISTPPGYGYWDFAIYLFPFLLLGGFWAVAMRRRNRIRQLAYAQSADSSGSADASSPDDQGAATDSAASHDVTSTSRGNIQPASSRRT